MSWWPIIAWAISFPLIALYGWLMLLLARAWSPIAMKWLDGYIPRESEVLIVEVAQKAQRLGVWTDHAIATFWLHFITEIDTDRKGNPKQSVLFFIMIFVTFISVAMWGILTLWGAVFQNMPVMLGGLVVWYGLWMLGLSLMPVTWWLADWSRHYSGAVIMSEGPSYAVKTVFSLVDLLTFGDPKFSVYPVKPEKVTQTPMSTDPEELARVANIETNELTERLINWFITPRGITAVRMLALAAEYGRPMFIHGVKSFWKAIDQAADTNVLNGVFADGALKDGTADYRAKRHEGASINEALMPLGVNISMIKEWKGPKVEVTVIDLMKPDFTMPSPPAKQYRGSGTTPTN